MRSRPNIASTPMPIKNRVTILTITLEPKPRVKGAFLYLGADLGQRTCTQPLHERAAWTMHLEDRLVAIPRLHHGLEMADPIRKANIHRTRANPDFAGEKILIIGQQIAR